MSIVADMLHAIKEKFKFGPDYCSTLKYSHGTSQVENRYVHFGDDELGGRLVTQGPRGGWFVQHENSKTYVNKSYVQRIFVDAIKPSYMAEFYPAGFDGFCAAQELHKLEKK